MTVYFGVFDLDASVEESLPYVSTDKKKAEKEWAVIKKERFTHEILLVKITKLNNPNED